MTSVGPRLRHAAPQFLVADLAASLRFYERQLGFTTDFVYDDFYASVSRDGATLHLKCAPGSPSERSVRQQAGHLDAFVSVEDARTLHLELTRRGAPITQPLVEQAWRNLDFQVTDPDGYVLCFSQTL